ncbi:MAG: hypothetical protein QOG87_3215 [Actinomycetota bacterium]
MSRPMTAASVAGTAAHHTFELAAGVGLVLQPELGLPGSVALWSALLPVGYVQALRSDDAMEPVLAFGRGAALAGVATHFLLWPWRRRLGVFPWLTEAEGLRGRQIPVYNALLYIWGAAAAGALVKETPPRSRKWAALGLASTLVFRKSAEYHFRWATEQARTNPQWWNRGLR